MNSNVIGLLVFCVSTLISWALTHVVRGYVLRRNILDIPNERSSHKIPTPRGGGLAVAATFLVGLAGGLALPSENTEWLLIVGATFVISLLGWWDDRRGLSAGLRLAVQTACALVGILGLEVFSHFLAKSGLDVAGFPLPFAAGVVFFVLFTVWMTNLYNFMDGIDGILGLQTLTVAIGTVFLLLRHSTSEDVSSLVIAHLILGGSAAGFLILNWSPAKIFMGDVGSAAIGFLISLLGFHAVSSGLLSFTALAVVNAAFIVDATVTLLVRLSRGKKPHQAHRSHFYQKMVQSGWTHARVSSLFAGLNLLWLTPIAFAIEVGWLNPILGSSIAIAPILVLAFRFRAGVDAA